MNWFIDTFKKSLNLLYGVFTKDQTHLMQNLEKQSVDVVCDVSHIVLHVQDQADIEKLKEDEISVAEDVVQLILEEVIKTAISEGIKLTS
jgi:biotin synthase-related radical SAM superfamily protein